MHPDDYPASSSQEVMGSLARALYEKGGPEILKIIESVFRRLGQVQGDTMKKKLVCGDFVSAVKGFFGPALKSSPPRAEFVELTEHRLVLKAFTCRMGIQGVGGDLCRAIMELDREMIGQMAGQEVEMRIDKSLAAGDNYCLIEFKTIAKKDGL
ncbi:hypothetical protein IT084_16310 [Desulfallas sp. Bu1-1]|uniref:hypothetical protein n=1 Tax=Desulfallas sp. Bu1-1 TaxID=2787620 RepID=UPI00189C635D|nr:hypothetical protein [Desulfallas sp. Bu1-1]MBF7084513.1 hypothetical protein [Desulfallas sp. Bu1-1]